MKTSSTVACKPLIISGIKQINPQNQSPAEIIYKVQSSDTLTKPVVTTTTTTTKNFLSSLKPAQTQSSTNPLTSDPTTIKIPTTLATSINITKRIKLSTDQLTKIKTSSSSSLPLTTTTTASITIKPEINSVQKVEETPKEPEKPETITDPFLYSLERFQNLIDKPIRTSFEIKLKRMLPNCPLIDRSNKRDINCASSIREYFSWPYGKRKAREWMRAVKLREMCSSGTLNGGVWTTKRIVLWLRAHGYTPLEYKNMIAASNEERHDDDLSYVNSYSSISRLFDYKKCRNGKSSVNDEESKAVINVLDVVNPIENAKHAREVKRVELESIIQERNPNEDQFNSIEFLTPGEKFIREELLKVY